MKYKLKQWYPSLPKDWEVGMKVEPCTIDKRYYVSNQGYKPLISQTEVENNPKFWEKIEEKEYEIIKETYNTLIGKWEIHSVKRLSDGEIFSVGDRVTWSKGKADYAPWLIDNFFIKSDNLLLVRGKNNLICEWIEEIKKTKEPILITEDGEDIFEGDTVYVTNIQANFLSNHSVTKDSIFKNSAFKYFAKKENMDRYIEENKPMYSKKDMLSFGASMSSKLYPYQCEGCLEHWKRFKKEKGE